MVRVESISFCHHPLVEIVLQRGWTMEIKSGERLVSIRSLRVMVTLILCMIAGWVVHGTQFL